MLLNKIKNDWVAINKFALVRVHIVVRVGSAKIYELNLKPIKVLRQASISQ